MSTEERKEESSEDRAARLKASHEAYVAAHPEIYPGRSSSSARQSRRGPTWAGELSSRLLQVSVTVEEIAFRLERLERHIEYAIEAQSTANAAPHTQRGSRIWEAEELGSDPFERTRLPDQALGG